MGPVVVPSFASSAPLMMYVVSPVLQAVRNNGLAGFIDALEPSSH